MVKCERAEPEQPRQGVMELCGGLGARGTAPALPGAGMELGRDYLAPWASSERRAVGYSY